MHRLRPKNNRIILTWRPAGHLNHHFSNTLCEVVEPDILPGCEIAVGEESGRDDHEDVEEELAYKDAVRNHDMGESMVWLGESVDSYKVQSTIRFRIRRLRRQQV